jgi:hypothetical protein
MISVSVLVLYVLFLLVRPDEELLLAAKAFYAVRDRTIPDEQNAAIGLFGLYAPAGADVMAHGKRVQQISARSQAWNEAFQQSEKPGSLDFKYTAEIECWLVANGGERVESKECASPERLATILRDNTHLARYKEIQKLPYADLGAYKAQAVIGVNKLLHAEILLDVEQGRTEEAYQKWRDNFAFIGSLQAANGTWMMTAVGLIYEGFSYSALDGMLRGAPQLIEAHYDELSALLKPGSLARYNLPAIMRAEEKMAQLLPSSDMHWATSLWLPFHRPNYHTNRQFEFAQAFLRVADGNPANLPMRATSSLAELSRVDFGSIDYTNAINSVSSRLFIAGQVKASELLLNMHGKNAQQRLYTLRLQIAKEKIPDAEIASFLAASPVGLHNPFDGKPMQWDGAKRTLSFSIPGKRSSYIATL